MRFAEQEFFIALVANLPRLLIPDVDHFLVSLDLQHLMLNTDINVETLNKILRCFQKQLLAFGDLASDVIRQTTDGQRYIGTTP